MPKKGKKCGKNIMMWHMFLHPFFKGLYKNIVSRSVSSVVKKLWDILVYYKKLLFTKNSLKFLFTKSQKMSGW